LADEIPPPFHQRFNIEIDSDEGRVMFVNRVHNQILEPVLQRALPEARQVYRRWIFTKLGRRDQFLQSSREICLKLGYDLHENLLAIEALYECASEHGNDRRLIDSNIRGILRLAEVDLGIEWRDGVFTRKGAALLDQRLVNDQLSWLRKGGMETVVAPFEKALHMLLQAENQPHLRSSVITNAYEALEALAKVVCAREGDLSGNMEQFLRKVQASDEYKRLLKEYIQYANRFRHAVSESRSRPELSMKEVESFVYMTGVFLRLAMPSN
jgi:hypothetical protein